MTAGSSPGGFDPTLFAELASIEEKSFWFRSRNELIDWAVAATGPAPRNILEIGCGTGFVLQRLRRSYPDAFITGTELHPEGLEFAAERVPDATLLAMDATSIPFVADFDLVGAFDVLEHIERDTEVLRGVHRALKPGGRLIVTVPQHPALWSAEDDRALHVRRYVAGDLRTKIEAAGLTPTLVTSFVTLLLPAMVASRKLRPAGGAALADAAPPGPIDRLLEVAMTLERAMIERGLRLPIGGSLMVVARKP
jgi:SAM-dependent methyltransferase